MGRCGKFSGKCRKAGRLGTGLAIVMLGGDPNVYKPLVDLYRISSAQAGHPLEVKVGVTGHAYILKTNKQA